MREPDALNIPAFQRKRSISARARKKTTYTKTKSKKRKTKSSAKSRDYKKIEPLTEIPLNSSLPSEELFPDPMLDKTPYPGQNPDVIEMKKCGICEGYFDNIEVAIIKLTSPLREGDKIILEKPDGLFQQKVKSMQINRKDVKLARTGTDIGMKVALKPKIGTSVYKVL